MPLSNRRGTGHLAAAALAGTLVVGLTGCSSGGSAGGGPAAAGSGVPGGNAAGRTVPPGPTVTPTPKPKPVRPTCTMLKRSTATELLGAPPTGRSAEVRQWPPGGSQLDGCTLLTSGGRSLTYVVWSTGAAGGATATPVPFPSNAPVVRFNPRLGQSSSGVSLTAGGRTTVEISASRSQRLVRVTAVAPLATDARRVATEAARTLLATD